ncbi:hypothetical protein VitviT2T_009494 [Vitis vinifera]|uniref:Beta-glucosidase 11 n=1 Tax=Vitis vinifera TaxID=29760 RepID=A0ABY9C5S8_VITVI|nr:hypothetical protein VitviT2T_009494 [Vitis vinifera]
MTSHLASFLGSGTSAYQVEGAAFQDGRTPSIWDTFTHDGIVHGATGDIACDEYHKYKEDVELMVETGLEAYRFSISWSRLIPNGRGPVNPKGLAYYNNFINELISHAKRDDTQPDQFPVMPWGLQEVLEYFKQVYGNPPVYIHENGQRTQRNTSLNDTGRVKYLQGYIGALLNAVRNGSNAKGYFIWSFLDVLELLDGYESSYGLYYVDLDDPDLKRYPKLSAHWYSVFLKGITAFSSLKFSRDDFPLDFIFGSGTSAYQVEGAAFQDGRTPSIWDTFTHAGQSHGATGDITSDQYHKYKDDVKLMVETGLEAYRFSISWSRLIPNGRGPVNPKGLAYYNNLINELLSHGIQPHVTLFHSDTPQALEDEEKYQDIQQGFIGTNVFAYWFVPLTNKTEDIIATQRAHDFFLGWFVHVLVFGDYPDIVKKRAGTRIPSFTEDESKQVKGSFDFIGINHYTSLHIKNNPMKLNMDYRDFNADVAADMIAIIDDTAPDQFPVLPWGLQQLLEYFKQVYGNPPIYIHENGQQTKRNTTLNDTGRVKYLQGYIGALLNAVRNGSNAKGSLEFSRYDFPTDFIFGAGTSAYQVEGAAFQDGRTPSTWDTFAHAGHAHGATGDIACDEYHKYKEDVKLMVETGLDAYRFSISWSRLIPNGRGAVNPKGLEYYNNLINELIKHGIEPHVTLFHIDLPQVLEDEYEGWLSRRIVKDFTEFADVCFREFGQQMKRNTTLNDTARVEYIQAYMGGLLDAIRNGSNARGYFIWSFLDVLEVTDGYKSSYGLYYVDLDDPDLKRYPKLSAHWYSGFLKGKNITPDEANDITKNKMALSNARPIQ